MSAESARHRSSVPSLWVTGARTADSVALCPGDGETPTGRSPAPGHAAEAVGPGCPSREPLLCVPSSWPGCWGQGPRSGPGSASPFLSPCGRESGFPGLAPQHFFLQSLWDTCSPPSGPVLDPMPRELGGSLSCCGPTGPGLSALQDLLGQLCRGHRGGRRTPPGPWMAGCFGQARTRPLREAVGLGRGSEAVAVGTELCLWLWPWLGTVAGAPPGSVCSVSFLSRPAMVPLGSSTCA